MGCYNSYNYYLTSRSTKRTKELERTGIIERFCTTKIRTKFRDRPCENVYEFSHELCVLHIFVVCTRQVHVRHDPISRNFLRKFISRSLQVSRPKLRKFVRSFSLRDVERKFVHIFVLQNLSNYKEKTGRTTRRTTVRTTLHKRSLPGIPKVMEGKRGACSKWQ